MKIGRKEGGGGGSGAREREDSGDKWQRERTFEVGGGGGAVEIGWKQWE